MAKLMTGNASESIVLSVIGNDQQSIVAMLTELFSNGLEDAMFRDICHMLLLLEYFACI